jgi:hypothetical protein
MLPRRRRDVPSVVRARVQARDHDGQNPRRMQHFRGEIGGERRQQRQRGLDRRIVDAKARQPDAEFADEPCDDESRQGSAARQQHELLGRLDEGKNAGRHCGDGELERDEPGRVVDEALAVQDAGDARRDLQRSVVAAVATASVGDTMAPSANAAASGSSGISQCMR